MEVELRELGSINDQLDGGFAGELGLSADAGEQGGVATAELFLSLTGLTGPLPGRSTGLPEFVGYDEDEEEEDGDLGEDAGDDDTVADDPDDDEDFLEDDDEDLEDDGEVDDDDDDDDF